MTKVMRKEARHTQRRDRASGVPLEILEQQGTRIRENILKTEVVSFFFLFVVICYLVAKSCLTLCNPMDYTVHGIVQARIVEWVAILFSRGSSQPKDWTQLCHTAGRFFTS